MSEQFDVILGGLDTEVDVTIADSTGVDPSVLLALRGEKGDTGAAGQDGTDGVDGADGFSPIATVSKVGDAATITITDINGTTTATVKDGTQANAFTAEFGTTTYADVKDAYDDDAIIICTADDSGNTMVLQLVYFDATNEIFFFAEPNGDGVYWTELSNANGWDDGTRYLASTDVATQLRDGLMSALDKQKLDGIASGAEVNVQSDWNQSVNTADDYIKNKPTIPSKTSDLVNDSLYARGHIASFHGTCTTGAATAAKAVTCADFKATDLVAGAIIVVSFSETNSAAVTDLTLNVNSTGAKPIKYINNGTLGNLTSAGYLKANVEYPFYYDGTNWVVWFNYNTTYSAMTESEMHAGMVTTGRLITAQRLYQAVKYHAPVTSVNGRTGAVTVTEGLAPLIGTTSTITPQQVMTALGEGRDICISASYTFNGLPLSLNFTAFNRAVDTVYSGQALDVVASQTIVNYNNIPLVFMLLGGISNGSAFTWKISLKMIPTNISDLVNDSDFVSDANYVHTDNNYTSTEKSKLAGIASGAEVNVQSDWNETNSSADDFIKNKPSIPSKTSDLTNDSDFVTSTELEEAIDSIPSGGGGGSTPTLLGSTPLKLTADTNVKLTATGSCTYTLESDTVADFDILNGTTNNATVYTEDNMYKVKASSSATAWYQSYVDIFVDGLTVGTTYNLCFDAVGCPNNSSTHTMIGHYILYDNSGNTLVTRGATDGPHLNTYAFQATTTKVKLRWYPSANSYFVAGTSVGNVNKIYIDRENETAHTDIVSSSGSFTDSAEIGQITKGVTISASPTASVYKMPASSGGASLPLEGKNVVVFGDSLIGMYRGDTSATTHLATVTGATVYNVGFGGCRMSTHPSHGYAEFSMWALADAVATDTWTSQDQYVSQGSDYFPEQLATLKGIDFNTVDYVVIHYGTNDFGGGVAIGASSASTDHSTLCGAARYSIEKLLTAYPKLRIFISLPVYRYWESGGTITYAETYTNSQNNKLYECVEALKTVAREYNLPTIDGYYELGINKVNASTFLLDGTHHNAVGRKRFGQFIGSKIVASM